MGKWIDRAVLTAFAAAALYLLFISAFGSILPAAALSFVCCSLLIHARAGRPGRLTRHQARTILERWAYGSDDDAKAHIEALIDVSSSKLVYFPKHPTATLSMSDIFNAWKSGRGEDRLIIAAPCYADGRARTFSRTLQHPCITILDASRLIPLIRKSKIPSPAPSRPSDFLRRLGALLSELPRRRPWYKHLASGLLLILMYLFSGSIVCLILATAMLFLSGVSLRTRA